MNVKWTSQLVIFWSIYIVLFIKLIFVFYFFICFICPTFGINAWTLVLFVAFFVTNKKVNMLV